MPNYEAPQVHPEALASAIDHTALKPATGAAEIRQLCAEAVEYGFASVCVNPTWVPLAAEGLAANPVRVCTVIGFPLGATLTRVKAYETEAAIAAGAAEVDMVINLGRLKDGDDAGVGDDIAAVVEVARASSTDERAVLVKVIIETVLLDEKEKRLACRLALERGADFVKTSTGFAGGGATLADVRLMRSVVGDSMGVKASGGIRSAADARAMLATGASRIGTSSGVAIMAEALGAERPGNGSSGGVY